jgi:hypothetical protein
MTAANRYRSFIVLVASVALLLAPSPALAAHHRRALTGCGAPAGSAINEYCDAIPTSTGGDVPKVGSPSVAKTLPHALVRQIAAGPLPQRKLLTLPAAPRHRRHAVRAASLGGSVTSFWSLSLTLILILVAIALVLGGVAAERWRRRRA